jgi:Mrp family chromosome partitioning ATPase
LAALHASVEFVAAGGSLVHRSGEPFSDAALVATSIDVLPPKAEPPAAVPLSLRARRRDDQTTPHRAGTAPRRFGRASSPKKPLSSFIARQRTTNPPADEDDPHELCPGTTVASFRWPAVCRALLQQSTTAFDDLADRILPTSASGPVVVGVLGLFRGTGCTTMALCLAARLTRRNRRVILVDGNFASPRLAELLDVVPTTGWQESLTNNTPVKDAIVRAVDDQLDLLALSPERKPDAMRLVAGPQTARIADQLRGGYQVVLVDLGAFFDPRSQPVALELISQLKIDSVLAITGSEEADPRDLSTLAERLDQRGSKLAGIAENRFAN